MKKFWSIFAVVMAVLLCMTMFVACSNSDNESKTEAGTQAPADNKVTVSWYEGSKLLKEEKVDKGSKLTSWEPTSDAGTFDGWYAEASKTTPFDFTKEINEDTDIFAKFRSDEFVADENEYYLIGAGAGDMGKAAWDHTKAAENLMMVKDTSITNANVYKITITMYAGDQFQICYGGTWDGQTGIGYIEGAEYCDGVNTYDKTEYTAADKKVAQVKDADGNVIFVGSDEYNKGYESWNAVLAAGADGKYEITFTTYPNAKEYNTITVKCVEKLEAMTETHKMYFIGTFNNWSETYDDDTFALTASDDKSYWTGIITITEDMFADWAADENGNGRAALKIFNAVNGGYYSDTGENIMLYAGTYAFKYTVEGDVVEFKKCDYYLVGTFLDADGNAVNFAVKEGVTPLLTADDDVYKVTFTATDVTANGNYSWIADQGKPGVMAFKVVLGSELGIAEWFSDTANNGDNFYVAAGEVTVTFDPATGAVTVA